MKIVTAFSIAKFCNKRTQKNKTSGYIPAYGMKNEIVIQ